MIPPPFPVIGVTAPIVASLVIWWFTNSTFAIVGAVIAPSMVIAHFVDARRRSRREARTRDDARAHDEATQRAVTAIHSAKEAAELARRHPSITDIARAPEWCAPHDGTATVRAGRDGHGRPWLIDLTNGVVVLGTGPASDAVWGSLLFHATAQLGNPVVTGRVTRWANGAWMSRESVERAESTIRCEGDRVLTVTARGELPESGDWQPDDVRALPEVTARLDRRSLERLSVSLTSETPHVLIAGRTGSGKSHALTALVTDWAIRFSPADFRFIGIDFKGGATLTTLSRLPNHIATVTDLDAEILPRVLAGISVEMVRRERKLLRQGVPAIEHASGIPRLAVVIDEVHEVVRRFPHTHELLADIARRGRSLGVHLVLSTQHPTGVVRDSVLGNIPIRICLAMNSLIDITAVLGRPVTMSPARGAALINKGDGFVTSVGVSIPDESEWPKDPGVIPEPLWQSPLNRPVPRHGRLGFGLLDVVAEACHRPAVWSPADGDVLVVGERGSGRTTALRALGEGHATTWIQHPTDLVNVLGIVVIDDLDTMLDRLTPREAEDFIDDIRRVRHSHSMLVSTRLAAPRALGVFRDSLVLRQPTLDNHRLHAGPPETFDPASAPGVGTWRGHRVVLYARTDSTDTASMP